MSDRTVWPEIFGLGGKTFLEVFREKSEWVDFTMREMEDADGIFKVWKNYCRGKLKEQNGGPDKIVESRSETL